MLNPGWLSQPIYSGGNMKEKHRKNWHLLGLFALLATAAFSLFLGVEQMSPTALLSGEPKAWQVFWVSRLPRLISVIIAGFGTGIAGLLMQQLSRNKFVSPTTSATVDSAKLGLMVSLLLFAEASSMVKMLIAFAFAVLGTWLFMTILGRIKYQSPVVIPLVGLMLGAVIDSVTTMVAYRFDLIQNIGAWAQGDFSMVIKGRYELLWITIPTLLLCVVYANHFTVAGMGEGFAVNLGLNFKQVVNIGLVIVSLISAAILIIVGEIPFVGLIIPNLVTLRYSDHMKENLWPTALYSALFLLLCDVVGRVIIYPYEMGVNLIAGVVGSLVFLELLRREASKG